MRESNPCRLALLLLISFAIVASGCSSPKTRFGYVATEQGVFAFRMDAKTGAGSQVFGSPFVAKTNLNSAASTASILVHPSGDFLYVADQDINSISLFKIDHTTGALTETLPRTSLTASGSVGLSPAVMTMDKAGQFLFVGNQVTNDVWVFSIGSTGALTFVSSALLAAPPSGLTLAASGNFLYVSVPDVSAIYVFSVSSGTLTQVGAPFVVSGGVGNLGIDPNGSFLYVPNPATDLVTVLRIQSDGTLGFGAGAFATGTTPIAAATNPTGAFLYVANSGSANVSQFQVDSTTGQLTPLTTTTAGTGTQPSAIVLDPEATFLFVVNHQSNSITEYTFNSKGTLVSTGNQLQLVLAPRSFAIAP
jgi:6-phosphogluconolactonase (cycloisomerase 2 family)